MLIAWYNLILLKFGNYKCCVHYFTHCSKIYSLISYLQSYFFLETKYISWDYLKKLIINSFPSHQQTFNSLVVPVFINDQTMNLQKTSKTIPDMFLLRIFILHVSKFQNPSSTFWQQMEIAYQIHKIGSKAKKHIKLYS